MEKPKLRPLEASPHEIEGQPVLILTDPEGFSDKTAAVPVPLALYLFERLDGESTFTELQKELNERAGQEIDLKNILDQLDAALFLESPRFLAFREEVIETYRNAPVRAATSAGSAYPDEPEELRAFLDALYEGVTPPEHERRPRAIAIPHLDFRFGGRAAARGLCGLDEAFSGDTVVVFGVGHQLTRLPYALTEKDYDTPLGTVPVNRDLLDRVVGASGSLILEEEIVHRTEHSIEFAALLLRHAMPDRDFRILPVLCGSFHPYYVGGEVPASDPLVDVFLETVAEEAGDALILAAVDLAHMGPNYGDREPLTAEDLKTIGEGDAAMLDRMSARDAEGFFEHLKVTGNARRVCGESAIYSLLRLLGDGPPGDLVTYEQPVFPGPGNTVTICSMIWR